MPQLPVFYSLFGLLYAIGIVLDAICILLFFAMLIEDSIASKPDKRFNVWGFVIAVVLVIVKMTHLYAYPNLVGLEWWIQFRLSLILIANYAIALVMLGVIVRYRARMSLIFRTNMALQSQA